jgi:hypothetical protein
MAVISNTFWSKQACCFYFHASTEDGEARREVLDNERDRKHTCKLRLTLPWISLQNPEKKGETNPAHSLWTLELKQAFISISLFLKLSPCRCLSQSGAYSPLLGLPFDESPICRLPPFPITHTLRVRYLIRGQVTSQGKWPTTLNYAHWPPELIYVSEKSATLGRAVKGKHLVMTYLLERNHPKNVIVEFTRCETRNIRNPRSPGSTPRWPLPRQNMFHKLHPSCLQSRPLKSNVNCNTLSQKRGGGGEGSVL